MTIIRVGLDTSKHVFQIHGVDENEQPVLWRQLRRSEVDDLDEACQRLEEAHGQRLTAKEESDAAMRDGVHANFEMKWSGPDGVVIDVSHTGWEGTH